MEQLPLFAQTRSSWTVSEISRVLREVIASEPLLQNVWVRGEISNFSRPKSGHWYFTLKDRNAQLPCVMWRSTAELQSRIPKDGEAMEVHGGLSVYEAAGRYQLYVDQIRAGGGEGALYQQFMELKARLEAEGLFAPQHKRPIPAWPRRIGIITSPSGAALHDILQTLARRFPLAEVVLAPVKVQGEGASIQMESAIKRLNHYAQPDLILLARGGGSLEDLAAFNSEGLARTIVASEAPVICGVGHETDFTIADFAADLRAPTPTAAAELATPSRADLAAALQTLSQQLARYSPAAMILRERQHMDEFAFRYSRALRQHLQLQRTRLSGIQSQFEALNPAAVLERGYAVVSKENGESVNRTDQVEPGEAVKVRVSDGQFGARVEAKD
ncbi:MAG: exodeoxyribonuclease VII large subunit [Anaerolineales bacterium]